MENNSESIQRFQESEKRRFTFNRLCVRRELFIRVERPEIGFAVLGAWLNPSGASATCGHRSPLASDHRSTNLCTHFLALTLIVLFFHFKSYSWLWTLISIWNYTERAMFRRFALLPRDRGHAAETVVTIGSTNVSLLGNETWETAPWSAVQCTKT